MVAGGENWNFGENSFRKRLYLSTFGISKEFRVSCEFHFEFMEIYLIAIFLSNFPRYFV